MAINQITIFCFAVFLLSFNSIFAQDDVRQQIRAIKMDQSYIKAEANDSIESEAVNAAALDLIYHYNAERMGRELDTISIEMIRPSLQSLVYARGSIKRVLVFVELAVADSLLGGMSQKNVVDRSLEEETPSVADIHPTSEVKVESANAQMTTFGDLILLLSNIEMVNEAAMLLKQYKEEGKISDYGQLRSLSDIPSQSFLLIYDRERTVKAILSPDSNGYYNVKRNTPDAITNYSGCGSLWFK